MGTRAIVVLLVALTLASVHLAEAQQPKKVPRIGFLSAVTAAGAPYDSFRRGLRDLGYVEGQNIAIEYRPVDLKGDRATDLVAELLRLNVDVIVTGDPAVGHVAKTLTTTVPILVVGAGDLVASGLVASLAHPGGNVTGLSALQLNEKRLEILKETLPKLSRVAILWNAKTNTWRSETEVAAQALGVQLQSLEVRGPEDLDSAFQAAKREQAGALVVVRNPITSSQRKRIADLAIKNQMPTIYGDPDFVEAGGLMSYGTNVADLFRRVATYVDKILKGAKPADLPVEQPMKFEFVINLKTAKQIGLTIPPNVLARADRVIK
jgi:putative tryptophan/tyrosine transport system substrate-binding protein